MAARGAPRPRQEKTVDISQPGPASDGPPRINWREVAGMAVAVVLVLWTLRAAAIVVVPLVFAAFLALLVQPVDRWTALHLPRRLRWLGHLVAIGVILLGLGAFIGCLWLSAQQLVERFPLEGEPIAAPAEQGQPPAGPPASGDSEAATAGLFQRLGEGLGTAGDEVTGRLADWATGLASTILGAAGTMFGATVLIVFLTLLMLIEAPQWGRKITTIADGSVRVQTAETLGIIADRLRRYLWVRTLLGLLTAGLYLLWLWGFGLDLLIVWVLLAFLLNFIPNLGSLIAGGLATLYAFVQMDLGTAVAIGLGILVIEQVVGNFIDPWVQGRQVSLSPLVVLVALVFWTWMWGIVGAFLAVPVTIAMAILSAHVDRLRPLALLLSNETDGAGLDRVTRGPSG